MEPALFRKFLSSGELILWSGKPPQGVIFRPMDALLIPFSLLWAGFALFLYISARTPGAPFIFDLLGLPLLLIGIYLTVGRFFHDAAIRKKQHYAVTTARILILETRHPEKLRSLDIGRLRTLELHEHRKDQGTINLESVSGQFNFLNGGGFGAWVPALSPVARFDHIEQPRAVYQLIQQQAAQPQSL